MGFLANFFVLEQCLRSQLWQCPLKPFWSDWQKKGICWSCNLSNFHYMFSDSRRLFRYVERDDTHTALGYRYIVKPSSNQTEPWNNTILQWLTHCLDLSLTSTAVIWALSYPVPQKPLDMVQLCNSLSKVTAREEKAMSWEPPPWFPLSLKMDIWNSLCWVNFWNLGSPLMVLISCFVEHTMTSYINTSGEGLDSRPSTQSQSGKAS